MRAATYMTILAAALGLAACTTPVPDSGSGVGFQDYNSYLREREASGTYGAPAPAAPVAQPGFTPGGAAAAIDRADGRVVAADPLAANGARPRGNAPTGIKEESGEMQPRNTGISDEQDFNAVSQRETIESDKARIDRNRAEYTVIAPGALPQRPGESGPNIVQYAIATTHPPGTQMHKRSSFGVRDPRIACAKFPSPDLAQEAFLAKGGPEKDRLGLDTDGDGYACLWDPRPFRTALQ